MQDTLHQLRKEVDAVIRSVGSWRAKKEIMDGASLEQMKCQRELEFSYTKLQEAKMWLGMALAQIGCTLPKEYQDNAVDRTSTEEIVDEKIKSDAKEDLEERDGVL